MRKFGLPDVALNGLSCYQDESTSNLINLICQTIAEKENPIVNGTIDLDIEGVSNESLKKTLIESLEKGAEKRVAVPLTIVGNEEGDPVNQLLGIRNPKNAQVYHDHLIAMLFGARDSIVHTTHDGELLEASNRAKKKLPELKDLFQKGLRPGEHILVKGPFRTPSGDNEWMWVEVTKWSGTQIHGILQNNPFEVPDLKAGSRVKVPQNDVFDYIHCFPDGTQEGNETGEIISRNANE
jgi:uncharacterized protein YegJ (DUF2314 family)